MIYSYNHSTRFENHYLLLNVHERMPQMYVCTQCGEEYSAPGLCDVCQIDLVPSDEEDQKEYGFHEEGLEEEEDSEGEEEYIEDSMDDEEEELDEEEEEDLGLDDDEETFGTFGGDEEEDEY